MTLRRLRPVPWWLLVFADKRDLNDQFGVGFVQGRDIMDAYRSGGVLIKLPDNRKKNVAVIGLPLGVIELIPTEIKNVFIPREEISPKFLGKVNNVLDVLKEKDKTVMSLESFIDSFQHLAVLDDLNHMKAAHKRS